MNPTPDSRILSAQRLALVQKMLQRQGLEAAQQPEGAAHQTVIARVPRQGAQPLSLAQERLWFLDRMMPGSPFYNLPVACRLRGRLDCEALQHALQEIVRRHETLRSGFGDNDGHPMQFILPQADLRWRSVDLSGSPNAERAWRLNQLLDEEVHRPFQLSQPPLLRVLLIRLGEQEHVLMSVFHHIVSDAWSVSLFMRELGLLYQANRQGRHAGLAELPVQYLDFALWQRSRLDGPAQQAQIQYWREHLGERPPLLDLPGDHPRPGVQTFQGGILPLHISSSLTERLESLSRAQGASLFMVLLASYAVLLKRYSGQQSLVLGTPVANRGRSELEGIIGFFVNTLALRLELGGNPSFGGFVQTVRQAVLGGLEHSDLTFDRLVDELRIERDLSRPPLVQAAFALQNVSPASWPPCGLDAEPYGLSCRFSRFELLLALQQSERGLEGHFEYSSDLFAPETIRRMGGQLVRLLEGIASNPGSPIADLPLLKPAERQQLLQEWNDTQAFYPRQSCIHELFGEQARLRPDAAAMVFEPESAASFGPVQLSYAALDRFSDRMAQRLKLAGAGPELAVGICLHRSIDLIVILLGILKAGGAYLHLEPSLPLRRRSLLLKDSRAAALVADDLRGWQDACPQLPVLTPGKLWEAESQEAACGRAEAENLAYVSYTSGSTGEPKGVGVTHRSVARLVRGANYAVLSSDQVFLMMAPVSFDASTLEIWGCLLNGGRLAVLPPAMPSVAILGELLRRHSVSTLWLTAGLFHLMAEENLEGLAPVRQLLAGGDVLSAAQVRRTLQAAGSRRLINGYGPTENTTFTSCHSMRPSGSVPANVPIGRPVSNTQAYILDEQLQPVPAGVPGQLHCAGDGLARGYLHRPRSTAERFIPDPVSDFAGGRLYRTGDRARWLVDGSLEFLGRIDRQVKIRGFRIEPGELEAALCQSPEVRQAAVAVQQAPGQSGQCLAAFVVAACPEAFDALRLQSFLRDRLPDYLQPDRIFVLAELPLNANGKLDRKALAQAASAPSAPAGRAPRGQLERRIAAVWAEVLNRPVGVTDNFFEAGGNSLLLARLQNRLEKALQLKISIVDLYKFPTVAALAESLSTQRADDNRSALDRAALRRQRLARASRFQ